MDHVPENNSSNSEISHLNQSQEEAVFFLGAHLLIVAGPGTGKTHTLTYRIAYLLGKKPNKGVLAITFTQKASLEMRERIYKIATREERKLFVGTFHQFCLDLLRKNGQRIQLPDNFSVIGEDAQLREANAIWPDQSKAQKRMILAKISRFKSCAFDQEMPEIVSSWNNHLRKQNFLDYDDLILEAYRLLSSQKEVLANIQETFEHICVDEFQDVNRIQHALLKLLVGRNNFLTAIGDPNQAIYGFRGSDVKFFESFEKDFSSAKVFRLNDNYRSGENILSASKQVLEKGDSLFIPKLDARLLDPGRIVIHESPTDKAEAEYVVHQIERLVGGVSMFSQDSGRVDTTCQDQCSFGDFAILYRLKSQARALKSAFERSGIPYVIFGEPNSQGDCIEDVYAFEKETDNQSEKVSLMTLHASKGLEFRVIFMVGCNQNILPLNFEGLVSDFDEERRLFYVGLTRAKERIFLLSARRRFLYGKILTDETSTFVLDIDQKLKEKEIIGKGKKRKTEKQISLFE